jgi:iron complex outermembrane receptor protein
MTQRIGFDWSIAASALIAALLSLAAHAQVLEEIIVTAQKREQSLQDVGISVTAFSGEQIKNLGFTSTLELGAHTPGLLVTDTNAGTTTVFIMRGSGQLDFADHQEPPVAVYLDGAYNSFLGAVGFKFFDLERVEVLRGPQGTLFGRNATGGVVHLISAKPADTFEGYGEVTGGEYGLIRVEGAVSGPLGDALSGRLAIFFEETDGYQENRIGEDQNAVENKSGRAQLLFEPSETLQFHLSGQWGIDDNTAQGYDVAPAITDSSVFGPITDGVDDGLVKAPPSDAAYQSFCTNFFFSAPPPGSSNCFGFMEPDDGVHKIANNLDTNFDREVFDVTGTLTWNFGLATLVSVTDYKSFDKDYVEDSDSSSLTLMTFPQTVDASQFSQELRIEGEAGRLRWVGGFYYLNIDSDYRSGVDLTNALAVSLENTYDLETESWAVFGQAEYDFAPRWTAIAGVRWTEDDKDMVLDTSCAEAIPGICDFAFGAFVQVTGLPSVSRSEGDWSGKFELDYRPNEDWLLYAGVTRGHKAGGFNAGAVTLFTPEGAEYDGEILTSYEGGFKATLLGGSTRLNAGVFHYDYDDFQTFSQFGLSLIVFNVDSEVTGGEIELTTNPWEGWEFLIGVSLLDAEQKDLTFAGVTRDRPMPNAPDVSLNGLGRYEWPLAGGTMSAQLDFTYVDERTVNAIDHPALLVDDYLIANARLGYVTGDGHWEGSLFINNFTDEDYFHTIFDITTLVGSLQRIPGPPQWLGGTLRYRWD